MKPSRQLNSEWPSLRAEPLPPTPSLPQRCCEGGFTLQDFLPERTPALGTVHRQDVAALFPPSLGWWGMGTPLSRVRWRQPPPAPRDDLFPFHTLSWGHGFPSSAMAGWAGRGGNDLNRLQKTNTVALP